jgi:ubiquinone/menaquinone biosynthesis C-methylase UbiE
MNDEPDFGNWIRLRRVVVLLIASTGLLTASAVLPSPWNWLLAMVAIAGLAMGLFLLFIHYQFDDRGGGVQRQLWTLTLDHLDGKRQGIALDVGTGNGSLAVMLAMQNESLRVTGVDLWNPDWEYSIDQCEQNAIRAGVRERVTFERASADDLPFPNDAFDNVVSHFVFHEVTSASDKLDVVQEALRVLKRGGHFSFHDMFFDAALYGSANELVELLKSAGVESVRLVDSRALLRVNRVLMGKRILGNCAILCGRK